MDFSYRTFFWRYLYCPEHFVKEGVKLPGVFVAVSQLQFQDVCFKTMDVMEEKRKPRRSGRTRDLDLDLALDPQISDDILDVEFQW